MNEELPLIENEAQFTQDMHDELSFGVNPDVDKKEDE